jgi:nucleoid-associated protein YgaU
MVMDHIAMKHLVQSGETLQSIALQYYGSTTQWTRIYNANRKQIPTPDSVYSGQVLNIP